MDLDRITVHPSAVSAARDLRISGDLPLRLKRMAARSAPLTHAQGNRRFHDYALRVVGDCLVGIARIEDDET